MKVDHPLGKQWEGPLMFNLIPDEMSKLDIQKNCVITSF